MLFYLAFKNIISRKSSFVIVFFIAFAVMLIAAINSVFDSTENGIEKVFSKSFTGDLAIFPKSDIPMSLFGDETPVTGTLTKINAIVPFNEILDCLNSVPEIAKSVPQVTGGAALEFNGTRTHVWIFGVPASDYLECMSSIKILEGAPFSAAERGVMLSKKYAQEMNVRVGDTVQFLVVDGPSFRIRAAKVSCVYEYPVENSTLERIVLADAFTVRSLMDMSEAVADTSFLDEEKTDLLEGDSDVESLFDDAEDVSAVFVENPFEENQPLQDASPADSSSWNYIVCSLAQGENSKKTIRSLNRIFKKNSWPVRAVAWRTAAGSTALYLYWMRVIFNAGVLVVLATGFIIINNALVVNVLNRTQEIGTLRAQGASRLFVSLQCMAETFMLTAAAGILGCILGAVCTSVLSAMNIEFKNTFLIQLFGTDRLAVSMSLSIICKSMLLSILLGLLGWIYPVRTALRVNPVQAMQGAV